MLFLVPIAVAEWRSPASSPVAAFLECGSLCLLFPYLVIAPPFQAMATSWAAYRFLQGEPVNSLREVWDAVRPRLGQLIANQLLAFMVLGLIYVVIGVMAGIGAVAGAVAIGSLGLGGTASLIMLMLFYLLGTIVLLLLTALATVWVIILPQIILFEPETDALTAFSRAFTLVGKIFGMHLSSCLLFWAFQGVVYLSAYMFLGLVVLTVAGLLYAYGVDLQALYMRWANTFGNLVDVVKHVVFALVYPAMYLTSFFFYFDLRYRAGGAGYCAGTGTEWEGMRAALVWVCLWLWACWAWGDTVSALQEAQALLTRAYTQQGAAREQTLQRADQILSRLPKEAFQPLREQLRRARETLGNDDLARAQQAVGVYLKWARPYGTPLQRGGQTASWSASSPNLI